MINSLFSTKQVNKSEPPQIVSVETLCGPQGSEYSFKGYIIKCLGLPVYIRNSPSFIFVSLYILHSPMRGEAGKGP